MMCVRGLDPGDTKTGPGMRPGPAVFARVVQNVYIICSSAQSSRTRMPMSSRVPTGNLAMDVLSNFGASRVSGSRRGFAPVTSGPCF